MSLPRPRNFDENVALVRALTLFWRHGYDGTSLHDSTASMGINRPGLYAPAPQVEGFARADRLKLTRSPQCELTPPMVSSSMTRSRLNAAGLCRGGNVFSVSISSCTYAWIGTRMNA